MERGEKTMLTLHEIKRLLEPVHNTEPVDDFRILNKWPEYEDKEGKNRKLKYVCFQIESMDPDTGEVKRLYKCLKFVRVRRIPKSAKSSTSLMDMMSQILSAGWENHYHLITAIANILKPTPLGLLFLYGVQGVDTDLNEARRKADYDFNGLIAILQGTFRVLHFECITAQETEWLIDKMYHMEYLTVVRGIPNAKTTGEDMGNKGVGGSNLNPDSEGTIEEFVTAMAQHEYVVEVISSPVYRRMLEQWQRYTQDQMTRWQSRMQGSKSISASISIPFMYAASAGQSQGWSRGVSDSRSRTYSTGESYTTGFSQNTGHSISKSMGETFGMSSGTSRTQSTGQSYTVSNGQTVGQTKGITQGYTQGQTQGITQGITQGHTIGQTQGVTIGRTSGITSGYSHSQSMNYSLGNNRGTSLGTSIGQSQNVSMGQSAGMSMSRGYSQGMNQGLSYGRGESANASSGMGQSASESYNQSHGNSTSLGHSLGNSHNISNSQSNGWSLGTNNSISQSGSKTRNSSLSYNATASGSENTSGNQGYNSSNSSNVGYNNGRNAGVNAGLDVKAFKIGGSYGGSSGTNQSNGTSSGISGGLSSGAGYSEGSGAGASSGSGVSSSNGVSQGASAGVSGSAGTSEGFGKSESYSIGQGQSYSQGYGASHGSTSSISIGNGVSSNFGQSLGQSQSLSASQGTTTGASYGVSAGQNSGQNIGQSSGVSYSISGGSSSGYSQSASNSVSASQSRSISESNSLSNSLSKSNSSSISNSVSQSVSNSQSVSQSTSQGQSQGLSIGESQGQTYSQSSSQGTGESYSEGNSVSNGKSESNSSGTSSGVTQGVSGGISRGFSGSMGIGPSIGYNKGYQWIDQKVKDIVELLTFQSDRIKMALRGEGMFYTMCYIACPDIDALAAAQAAAKSTWQNEYALCNPLTVLSLSGNEQAHLLYHFQAFSIDMTKERVEGVEQYKYETLLLPKEYVAYTHLPRISDGGVDANIDDIPKFRVPSMMKGNIYMGTILNSERYTFDNEYKTAFDYRIDIDELMHGCFTGQSRSGKTVAAMRFVAELSQKRRSATGKRMRVVVMDPKQDWRGLARFVEPERFRFYSMGDIYFHPINLNPCKIPWGVRPQHWVDNLVNIFCRAYGLLERGKQMMSEAFFKLYEEAGVFDVKENEPGWQDKVVELSKTVTFAKVYDWMEKKKASLEDPNNKVGKAGNDTRDAYARLLERLSCFSRKYSIERKLFSHTTTDDDPSGKAPGIGDGLGVDELIGADDVTIFESHGLESTFANFIFAVMISGYYFVAKSREGGFLAPDQYETVMVIEEANKVLIGNDTAGSSSKGGGSPSLAGESIFEEILDQAAGYGLFVIAITQKISQMPSSVIANCGLLFVGRLTQPEDVNLAVRMIGREERREDVDVVKFIPKMPVGWMIVKSSRVKSFVDAEPVLIKVKMLNKSKVSNTLLDEFLEKGRYLKMQREFQQEIENGGKRAAG